MGRQVVTSLKGIGPSGTLTVDINVAPVNVSCAVILSPDANLVYDIEHTYDDLWSPIPPEGHVFFTFLSGQTANSDGYYGFPVNGIRIRITSYTSGTATLKVVQAGV
jgi:hypothetical protein